MIHTKTLIVDTNLSAYLKANRKPGTSASEDASGVPTESFASGHNLNEALQANVPPSLYRPDIKPDIDVVSHEEGHQILEGLASPGLRMFETPYIEGGFNTDYGAIISDDAFAKIVNKDGHEFASKAWFGDRAQSQDFLSPDYGHWVFDSTAVSRGPKTA